MKELFVPLSAAEIDPILDFADRALVQQHILTAPRLCLLAAVEELFFTALASGRAGHVRCTLDGSGGVRLSFQTGQDPFPPVWEEPDLPTGFSFLRNGSTYTLAPRSDVPALLPDI